MRTALLTLVAALAAGAVAVPAPAEEPKKITVVASKYERVNELGIVTFDLNTGTATAVVDSKFVPKQVNIELDPAKTAVVVCDMWDDHWCKKAAERCGVLAKKAEPVLKACRDNGMTIIHCPSDCMDFYKDHPARKRAQAAKKVDPPKGKDLPNPPLPVDDSDGGCDDDRPARPFKAWTRQHAAITIDEKRDYISDNGTEVYSIMKEKGIDTLIVMGVHTNMCVLNRSFAIKQMVKWNVRTLLVRDLTDAMYNPKMKPFVTHERGTELIIDYIEQNWCPTIESKALLGK